MGQNMTKKCVTKSTRKFVILNDFSVVPIRLGIIILEKAEKFKFTLRQSSKNKCEHKKYLTGFYFKQTTVESNYLTN